jgi:hypothetical protein
MSADSDAVLALVERVRPLFAGQPPELVGATHALWAALLAHHCAAVCRLTEIDAKLLRDTQSTRH